MDSDPSEPEPEKPRFLLPDGCKDLIDVLRRQGQLTEPSALWGAALAQAAHPPPQNLPASVKLPERILVYHLAMQLGLEPYHIIGVLMEQGVFATMNHELDFAMACKVCAQFGVVATNS